MIVMRNSRLIADASPREVFADTELMHSTHITPPQITSIGLRWPGFGEKKVLLSVDEAVNALNPSSPPANS